MDIALTIALTTAAIVWLSFSVWYITRARWWKGPFGWNTLGVSLLLTIIFGRLALLVYEPHLVADIRWTGLTLYILASGFGLHRIYLLEKAQRSSTDK